MRTKAILFVAILLITIFQSTQLSAQVWQYGNGNAWYNGGNVGIGTNSPGLNLHVIGNLTADFGNQTGFVTLWGDNAVIWKHGNNQGGLRFGSASTISAGGWVEKMRISDDGYLGVGTTTPASMLDVVTGNGDGTTNEVNCLRLRQNGTTSNTQLLQLGVNNTAIGGANQGYGYISSVYWGGSENNPLVLNPKGGPVGFGVTSGVHWNATVKDAVAVKAPGAIANNSLMGKLVFAHSGPYSGNSSFIAGVYDKNLFSQGAGMVFHTVSGADISGVDGVERMRITSDGNVGIGTSTPQAKLAVNGTVCATKVRVSATGCWADYVFNTGYRLRPLSEVEQYINQYHHLPEVPSAEEVEKNGLDVGDNQATLLKKIEELTLYVIEQNKKIEALEAEMRSQKRKKK
jgi:hypothetical protein